MRKAYIKKYGLRGLTKTPELNKILLAEYGEEFEYLMNIRAMLRLEKKPFPSITMDAIKTASKQLQDIDYIGKYVDDELRKELEAYTDKFTPQNVELRSQSI